MQANWIYLKHIPANGLRLCAAALDNLNNSASTVQRWRRTAVIGSVRQLKRKWI